LLADKLLGNFQIKCIWGEGDLPFNSIYIFRIKMTAQVLQLSPKPVPAKNLSLAL